MELDVSSTVMVGLAAAAGGLITKAWDYFAHKNKVKQETNKLEVESNILTAEEQRDKGSFYEDQLSKLEDRYRSLQSENADLTKTIKILLVQSEERGTRLNSALKEVTFLKIELAGYK